MPWADHIDPLSPVYGIAASTNPRVRVVAGPGTGKSFAMKRRVARLLEAGVPPRQILPVTFTRVAAEDLHRELVGMGVPGCEALEGVTLHSLGMRILMRNQVLATTGRIPRTVNDFELKPLVADLAGDHGGLKAVRRKIKAYEAAWARLQYDEPGYVQTAEDAALERDLLSWLNFHRAMLIGEIIPQLYEYLRSNPGARERTEFSHILVDEFQDLNRAEQGVVALLSNGAHVCIVGDDDQSIYSFKHAHPEGIRDWLIANHGAEDLTLGECRRCPTTVVNMANALIAHNVNRPVPRTLTPVAGNGPGQVAIIQYPTLEREIEGVVGIVQWLLDNGHRPGDILVLAQRGVIGTPIYEALRAREIPARSYYAEAELGAQEAQELFAYLKLTVEAADRVALRWLVGLGSANWYSPGYRRLRAFSEQRNLSPWDAFIELDEGRAQLAYTAQMIERFREIRGQVTRLRQISDEGGLRELIDTLFPEDAIYVRDIRALSLSILDNNAEIGAHAFLSELTSAIAKPEVPSEVEDVRVMSLHKSKGLSSPATIIAGCVEGLLPSQPDGDLSAAEVLAQIEEQRRLFYVGISRVKAEPTAGKPGSLVLTYCQQMSRATAMGSGIVPARFSYGEAYFNASRFIREMGPAAPQPQAG